MRGIEREPKILKKTPEAGKSIEKPDEEMPEKRKEKESYREIISGKLRKLTEMIEKATLERMLTDPDAPATEKNFEKLNNRLTSEAEVLTKRYNIEDEVDEKGKVKRGSEKILETIGYDYSEKEKYEGVRKGDLKGYERNALFKMWNLPAEEKDIKEFEERFNKGIEKLLEKKEFKKYGITKEQITEAIGLMEIDYKKISKEEILFLEDTIALNDLKVDKKGEIKIPPSLFWESPKAKWLKTAFAVGLPTLLLFSFYSNTLGHGKEKPVSLEDLEKNPDLLEKVPKKAIFNLIAPEKDASVWLNKTDKFSAIPINLNYHYDNPYFFIGAWVEPEYYKEMKKIGLNINYERPDIPLSFYLENQAEVDEIISKYYNISSEEMKRIDTLLKINEFIEDMRDVPIRSWNNFSIGEDTSENVKKIDNFRELLKEGNTEAIPSYDLNFTVAIDKLFQKEGCDETKLKEIAKENPKKVIEIVAEIIHKNAKYDYEKLKAMEKTKKTGWGSLSDYEKSLLKKRSLVDILEKGGVCKDISEVNSAVIEYLKSKEILPQNLLVGKASSRTMEHAFNSVFTVDSSGKLVSTYIDVTWFASEEISKDLYAYDLNAVDYYHQLGLSKEKIKKIMTARFSEYAKLIQDITTYDPWLHKKESEIKINDKG